MRTSYSTFVKRIGALFQGHPQLGRIGRGAAWALSGEVVGRGSAVLAGFVAARLLEVTGFGQLGMIRSTIGTFAVFAGFGLGVTATSQVAKYRQSNPQMAGEIIALCNVVALVLGTLMGLVLLIFAQPLSSSALLDSSLTVSLRLGAAMVFLGALIGVGSGTLAGFEEFRGLATASAAEGVTVLAATVPLAYLFGVDGAVMAIVLAQGAKFLVIRHRIVTCCSLHNIVPVYGRLGSHVKLLWQYSLPAFLCGFMYGPAIWVLNRMVIAQPDGYKMLGIMSAAEQWKTLILFVPTALGSVILPILANLRGSGTGSYKNMVLLNLGGQLFIALMVALPVVIMSSFVASLYGPSFEGLGLIIIISSATALFHTLGNAAGNALMTAKNIWPNVLLNLIWAICLIGSGFIFVRIYGILGLAFAYLFTQIIHGILTSLAVLARKI
jgi:O-antigen/teichoic acid export membrane protein